MFSSLFCPGRSSAQSLQLPSTPGLFPADNTETNEYTTYIQHLIPQPGASLLPCSYQLHHPSTKPQGRQFPSPWGQSTLCRNTFIRSHCSKLYRNLVFPRPGKDQALLCASEILTQNWAATTLSL